MKPQVSVTKLVLTYLTGSGRRSKKTIPLPAGAHQVNVTAHYQVAIPKELEFPVGELDKELVERLVSEAS